MISAFTRRAALIGAAALVASPATAQVVLGRSRRGPAPERPQPRTRHEASFRLINNQPLTQVTIDGHGPFWFLLDTGASDFCINLGLANRLNLPIGGAVMSYGVVGRAQEVPVFRVRELIVAQRMRDTNLVMFGLPALQGLAGLFPMVRGVPESGFDFDRRMFVVDTRPPEAHPGFERVAARMETRSRARSPNPRISAHVDGRAANLTLDTGANGALLLTPSYVRRHGLWDSERPYRDSVAQGAAGTFRTRLTTLPSLTFGRFTFQNVPVSLGHPDDHRRDMDDSDGLLGMEVLRRLNFFLRPGRDEVWLKPSAALHDVYRYDRSGIGLGWRDGQAVVLGVRPGSPGERAGLREGDVVTSSSAAQGSYDALVFALSDAPGVEVGLTVVRDGGSPREVTVALEDPLAR